MLRGREETWRHLLDMHKALWEFLNQLHYIPLFPAWTVTNHMTVRTQEDVQNSKVFLRHFSSKGFFKTKNRQQRGMEEEKLGK